MKFDREIYTKIKLINNPDNNEYRGEIDVRELKMSFSVFKSLSWSTNKGELRIWNLGSDKRNQLYNIGDLVSIYAGYKQNGGAQLLFTGNTIEVAHTFPQPEIITSLICGDGDKSLNNIKISISYGSNTPVRTVIEGIASKMEMPISSDIPTLDKIYTLGFEDIGLAKNLLDKVCLFGNLWWGVQNGNLVFQRADQPNQKTPVIINSETGMIGIPERWNEKQNRLYVNLNKVGWKIRTLLMPDVLPGDRVIIKSNKVDVNGEYFVETIQHDGDNYTDTFQSILQVVTI